MINIKNNYNSLKIILIYLNIAFVICAITSLPSIYVLINMIASFVVLFYSTTVVKKYRSIEFFTIILLFFGVYFVRLVSLANYFLVKNVIMFSTLTSLSGFDGVVSALKSDLIIPIIFYLISLFFIAVDGNVENKSLRFTVVSLLVICVILQAVLPFSLARSSYSKFTLKLVNHYAYHIDSMPNQIIENKPICINIDLDRKIILLPDDNSHVYVPSYNVNRGLYIFDLKECQSNLN